MAVIGSCAFAFHVRAPRSTFVLVPLRITLTLKDKMLVTAISHPPDVRSDDRERVLGKIQALVVDWLDQLACGDIPVLEVW